MSDGKGAAPLGEAARRADEACEEDDIGEFLDALLEAAEAACPGEEEGYLRGPEPPWDELARLVADLMRSYCGLEEGFRGAVGRLCGYFRSRAPMRPARRTGSPKKLQVDVN